MLVLWLYVSLKLWQSIDAHSGYDLPFPFSPWSALHVRVCARISPAIRGLAAPCRARSVAYRAERATTQSMSVHIAARCCPVGGI